MSFPYRKRLNTPTEWSLSVLPGFRNNLRGVCDVVASHGHADGGILQTLRFAPQAGRATDLRASVLTALPKLAGQPRVTGAHLVICDTERSGTNTALQRGRNITPPQWVLLVEGSSAEGVSAATHDLLAGGGLVSAGAAADMASGLYRFEYQVSRLTVDELPE